ncbi:MAG: GTP pyrophosphokinase [Magnetococcales bacterium]|nr:GTP pyrophosphokinase [Magnetococcales bacterium]NGZ06092.1 GTP pyrophosphokinase [Magnetococcales bacterium]
MATLDQAIAVAAKAHLGQMDKAGHPYILHPLRIMMRLESDEERMVAVLHDVIEDTALTLAKLRQLGFSETVLEALDRLTHRLGEQYEDYIERVVEHPLARRIKLMDLEDNMDVRRLANPLTDRDLARLQKYRRAWERLRAISIP